MRLVDPRIADRDSHLAGIRHVRVEPADRTEAPLAVVPRIGRLDRREPAGGDALGKGDRG